MTLPYLYIGNLSQRFLTFLALAAIASGALLLFITEDISSAISTISAFPIPRVVMHGVPRRIPLVTAGGLSSYGMAFLLTVMPALSRASSASFPVIFLL